MTLMTANAPSPREVPKPDTGAPMTRAPATAQPAAENVCS